ncbi:hypothetical protein NKG94_50905 [Micromonospora sp. M12]
MPARELVDDLLGAGVADEVHVTCPGEPGDPPAGPGRQGDGISAHGTGRAGHQQAPPLGRAEEIEPLACGECVERYRCRGQRIETDGHAGRIGSRDDNALRVRPARGGGVAIEGSYPIADGEAVDLGAGFDDGPGEVRAEAGPARQAEHGPAPLGCQEDVDRVDGGRTDADPQVRGAERCGLDVGEHRRVGPGTSDECAHWVPPAFCLPHHLR